ncbi:MAG TPA: FAD:protein FMN transferase ApbE [Oceanospirillaceae bacterium]|nr:FAD:protein FMN transferase ApbE [Oceanospirillaceae bacterium]
MTLAARLNNVAPKGATLRLGRLGLFSLIMVWLTACSTTEQEQLKTVTGLAMGTSYSVKWLPVDSAAEADYANQINTLIRQIEGTMSTYMDASDLSGLNGAPAGIWHSVPAEMASLITESQSISKSTNGAFDITIGPVVDLWGFGPDPKPDTIPSAEQLEALRPLVGYQQIEVRQNPPAVRKARANAIDLSAIAKGYAVDRVSIWLQEQGIEHFMVEIGGEIRTQGEKPKQQPWRIAIESPGELAQSVFEVVEVVDRALATSGNYRNYYEENGIRYAHTLDPQTLQPVRHKLASVTVMAESAARADALATALMVLGEDQGVAWATMNNVPAYFIIWQDGQFVARQTAGFEAFIQP